MSFLSKWHNTATRLLSEELERRTHGKLIEAYWFMNESPHEDIALAVAYTTTHKHNSIKNAYIGLAFASNVFGIKKLPLEYFDKGVENKRKIRAETKNRSRSFF